MTEYQKELKFVLVGAKTTGKTVYLSTLFGAESSITTTDKTTKDYLKYNWEDIKGGKKPSATASGITNMNFSFKSDEYNVPFCMDDYDGYISESLDLIEEEASEEDQSDGNGNSQSARERLKQNIEQSKGLMIFFPYEKDIIEEPIQNFRHEINTLINWVGRRLKNQDKLEIPVVFAVTKWDRSPHFKQPEEGEKAKEFINSVEPYRAVKEQLENRFEQTAIIPISSFGQSEDGLNPIKDNIEPYNITKPLEFFLNDFFTKFEKEIDGIIASNDDKVLYTTLYSWMDVVKFYDREKYKKLLNDKSETYAEKLLSKLRTLDSQKEQQELIKNNELLYKTMKTGKVKNQIEAEFLRTKKAVRKKRVLYTLSAAALLLITLFGFYTYNQQLYRNDLLARIRETKNADPYQKINLADEYLASFRSEKSEVERYRFDACKDARKMLEEKFSIVEGEKAPKLTEENYQYLTRLKEEALYFPDMLIANKIINYANDFESRYNAGVDYRQNKRHAIINARKALLTESDVPEDYEGAITALQPYSHDKEAEDLIEQLIAQKKITRMGKDFRFALSEIKLLNLKKITANELNAIINRNWHDEFTEEQKDLMTNLIEEIFAGIDQENIDSLNEGYESEAELKKDLDMIEAIKDHKLEIEKLNYRYVRSSHLQNSFERARIRALSYSKALEDGLEVNVRFVAVKENNAKLGFKCGGVLSNDDIVLKIGNYTFDYSENKGQCIEDGNRQVMTWNRNFIMTLKPKSYDLKVSELDTTSKDDTFEGYVVITDKNFLQLMKEDRNEFEVQIPNHNDYRLIFARR
jgi:hypothetical protein